MPATASPILVAAVDQQLAIGYGQALPWAISGDMRHFKRLTLGHCLLMGRATFDSLGRRALPGRLNIVLSSSMAPDAGKAELRFANSIESALDACPPDRQVFCIGGAKLYRQLIGKARQMYLTHINGRFAADTWFPDFEPRQWRQELIENHWSALPHGWRIVHYQR